MGNDWKEFIDEVYEDVGVWVTVPRQEKGQLLQIQRLELPDEAETPETPTVFKPIDRLINFQVVGQDGRPVQRFSPPMVLRVRITEAARNWAAQSGQLRLAFWDGVKWVPFTKRKHLFHLTSDHGLAVIRDWGDPAVAWG
jgi:hypothetical protein